MTANNTYKERIEIKLYHGDVKFRYTSVINIDPKCEIYNMDFVLKVLNAIKKDQDDYGRRSEEDAQRILVDLGFAEDEFDTDAFLFFNTECCNIEDFYFSDTVVRIEHITAYKVTNNQIEFIQE